MKEKFTFTETLSEVKIQENKAVSFDRVNSVTHSFRVHSGGYLGVYYHAGEISDGAGYARAEENLKLKRQYKFDLETGVRSRDKTERIFTDRELLDMTKEAVEHICRKYPSFALNGGFRQTISESRMENERGLSYSNKDCTLNAGLSFKHKDSKNIRDGGFNLAQRDYELKKLYDMADNYLSAFETVKPMPEEIIVQMQYYSLLEKLTEALNAESMCLGTSSLSGRIGERVFNKDFTLRHDVSDEECWHTDFFDGEGVTLKDDRLTYIENGVLLRGYADKKIAEKYGVEPTGSAWESYTDIPSNGDVNLRIDRSGKTVKELLNGRLTVVPVSYSGGGFNDKGEYVMPVQLGYLCDGERFLGRLPEFTLTSNMYDMFGDDFIGVGKDKPVFEDKQILVRMRLGKVNTITN
ncbi:MAG: metallopeptidase TldD-related protein [Bacteroides sp.]|nr:metallopeptidase TldD-related protein [Bacteroides sp.]